MLMTRIAVAIVLGPVILAVAVVGEPWLSILVGGVVVLGLHELIGLLEAGGFRPSRLAAMVSGIAIASGLLVALNAASMPAVLADLVATTSVPGLVAVVVGLAWVVLGLASLVQPDPRDGFVSWATTAFGVAYVGLLLPMIGLVGHLAPPDGTPATTVGALDLRSGSTWLLGLIAIVWSYDTGAYAVGRLVGRRRLIDHVSPSKTVEGLLGGLVLATIGAGLATWLIGIDAVHALALGPVVGLSAQVGDLAESLLKRAAGRKESGSLIPGHGGILDRVDSFLFAAPVLLVYALALGRTVA